MQELPGPAGFLIGMNDPRGWVHSLSNHLTSLKPQATATEKRLNSGLHSVNLRLAVLTPPAITVTLVPYPNRVRVSVWAMPWAIDPPNWEQQYLALMCIVRSLLVAAFVVDPTVVILEIPPQPSLAEDRPF